MNSDSIKALLEQLHGGTLLDLRYTLVFLLQPSFFGHFPQTVELWDSEKLSFGPNFLSFGKKNLSFEKKFWVLKKNLEFWGKKLSFKENWILTEILSFEEEFWVFRRFEGFFFNWLAGSLGVSNKWTDMRRLVASF